MTKDYYVIGRVAYRKQYYADHKEHEKSNRRAYYGTHKEESAAYNLANQKTFIAAARERRRLFRLVHPGNIRTFCRLRITEWLMAAGYRWCNQCCLVQPVKEFHKCGRSYFRPGCRTCTKFRSCTKEIINKHA